MKEEGGSDKTCIPLAPLDTTVWGPPGVWGIWGEWLFIFRELGSTGNYFSGAREHTHNFWGFREPCQKARIIRKSLYFV